jgi:WD40 repeat protein
MGIYPSSAIIAAGFKKSVPYNEPIVLYDTMAWNRPIMRIESETPPLNLAITDNKLICGTSEDVEIWDIRKTDRKVYDITLSLVSTENNPLKEIIIKEICSTIIINGTPSNMIVKQNIVRTLEQEYDIELKKTIQQKRPAARVAISTAANEFAVADGQLVKVYDLTSFKFKRDICLHNDTITAIAYSENGKLIAVGTDTGKTAAYRVPLKLNISEHTK